MMNKSNRLNLIAFTAIIVWVGYYLAVLLKTGFISDDAYNSQIRGSILHDGISIFQRISNETIGWITGAGRFFPLGFSYTYTLYYFIQSEIIIKSLTLIVILIGVISFATFVRNETNSWATGLFAGLLIPIFFQFRNWHDPLLAFSALFPLLFMYTMGALVLFQKYITNRKKYLLYASLLLYLLALLTYEVPYPLGVLFLIVAYSHVQNVKQAFKISLPHLFLSALFIGLMFALRTYFLYSQNIESGYPGAELHSNVGKVLHASLLQIWAAFPLSYYFSANGQYKLLLDWSDLPFILAFFIGTCLLTIHMAREATSHLFRLRYLFTTGILLLVLPALVISLSGHQDELITMGFGIAYIQVYFQYFGLGLVFIAGFVYLIRKIPLRYIVAFALVTASSFTIIATINLGLNRAVAIGTNQTYLYPRKLLEEALKAGIMDKVKDDALILRNMRFASDMTWFYSTVTGRKFNICHLNDAVEYAKCISLLHPENIAPLTPRSSSSTIEIIEPHQQDVWMLSYTFDRQYGKNGQLVLGKVDRIIQDIRSKSPIQVVIKEIFIFQQSDGKIHSLNLENSPINFLNILNYEDQRSPLLDDFSPATLASKDIDFRWFGGIFPPDGSAENNVRWSSGVGELVLYNFSREVQPVRLSMTLGTPAHDTARVHIQYPGFEESFVAGLSHVNHTKTLLLQPGETTIKFTSTGKPFLNGDPRMIVFGIFNFDVSRIKDGLDFSWGNGIFDRDGTDQDNVRWSSGKGTLSIQNYSSKPKTIKLSMGLAVPMHGSANVSIRYPASTDLVEIRTQQVDYSKTLTLPPGETLIKFSSNGKPFLNGDPRMIVFGVFNFKYSSETQ